MDVADDPDLGACRPWRAAVWALRCGYGALGVVAFGLVVRATGGTPWILAAGVVAWLGCAVVLAIGFVRTLLRHPGLRSHFLGVRRRLLSDTVHRRPPAGKV